MLGILVVYLKANHRQYQLQFQHSFFHKKVLFNQSLIFNFSVFSICNHFICLIIKCCLINKSFFRASFFITNYVFVKGKISTNSIVNYKAIENNTMHNLCLFSSSAEASLSSSTFPVHPSTNLSTNLFPHLQFSQPKYSPTSHDLSHRHFQLLGFQINPL